MFLDIRSARLRADSGSRFYDVEEGARRFETWERPVALWHGLGAASRYALKIGIPAMRSRISLLACRLQTELRGIRGVHVLGGKMVDPPQELCGIVSFYVRHLSEDAENVPSARVKEMLGTERINASVSGWGSTARDMERREVRDVVRLSVHYYNTRDEVEYVVATLGRIVSKLFHSLVSNSDACNSEGT